MGLLALQGSCLRSCPRAKMAAPCVCPSTLHGLSIMESLYIPVPVELVRPLVTPVIINRKLTAITRAGSRTIDTQEKH